MDHSYESTTVEMDDAGFSSLQDQILNSKAYKDEANRDIRDKQQEAKAAPVTSKKYAFTKGDHSLEIDEDYEIEIMADKKPTKLTLKELRERAAGEIAVKNRMHSLAEEKKRVQATYKEFAELAEEDPLAALEYISGKAKETHSAFEFNKFIEKLAEQAEKLSSMDENELKAHELEKKLKKAEKDLSQKAQIETVALRKQEILEEYPEIGDQQFGQIVDAVLDNDDLLDGVENENDVMDRAEELIQEILIQKDIRGLIEQINPEYLNDSDLIFSLSDQIRANPDFDEEDVRDIIGSLIGHEERVEVKQRVQSEREKDIQTLSRRVRESTPEMSLKAQNASAYDILAEQLKEKNKVVQKIPLWKRF